MVCQQQQQQQQQQQADMQKEHFDCQIPLRGFFLAPVFDRLQLVCSEGQPVLCALSEISQTAADSIAPFCVISSTARVHSLYYNNGVFKAIEAYSRKFQIPESEREVTCGPIFFWPRDNIQQCALQLLQT